MENNPEPLRFLTLQEAAAILHLSKRTVQHMIQLRNLPAFKVGSQWRIHEKAFAKWLQGFNEP